MRLNGKREDCCASSKEADAHVTACPPCASEDEWNMAEYTANVLLWGNIVPCHFFAKEMKRRYVAWVFLEEMLPATRAEP